MLPTRLAPVTGGPELSGGKRHLNFARYCFHLLLLSAVGSSLSFHAHRHGFDLEREVEWWSRQGSAAVWQADQWLETLGVGISTAQAADSEPEVKPPSTIYVVQPGDNLTKIAALFNLTARDIAQANTLSNPDLISVGQSLDITAAIELARSQGRQTWGDHSAVILAVAQVKGMDSAAQQAFMAYLLNKKPEWSRLPQGSIATDELFAWADTFLGSKFHVVGKGENVRYLAQKYALTESTLRDLNGLGPADYLQVGQVLLVSSN